MNAKQIHKKYEHAVIAVDVAIFTIADGCLKTLLIKMKKRPYEKRWALPGGLVRPAESVEAAAKRHLLEKSGVKNTYLEQLHTFGRIDRDPFGRVVSVAYFALISSSGIKLATTDDYEGVQWCAVNKLPALAYDHREIIDYAVKRLRAKLEYTNIVFGLLPKEFALGELQKIYEIILNKKIDKRNFRKKIESLGIIKKTGKKTKGNAHRPAVLYKFIRRTLLTVGIL